MIALSIIALASCSDGSKQPEASSNPFLTEYQTSFSLTFATEINNNHGEPVAKTSLKGISKEL